MIFDWKSGTKARASLARAVRRRSRLVIASAAALVLGIAALVVGLEAHSAPQVPTIYGTLDTQTPRRGHRGPPAGVGWPCSSSTGPELEPAGRVQRLLPGHDERRARAYQAAGMKVTLGLGLQNPPSWVLALADGTYIDQTGATSTEAELRLLRGGPHRRRRLPRAVAPHAAVPLLRHPARPPAATARCSTPAAAPTGPSTTPP